MLQPRKQQQQPQQQQARPQLYKQRQHRKKNFCCRSAICIPVWTIVIAILIMVLQLMLLRQSLNQNNNDSLSSTRLISKDSSSPILRAAKHKRIGTTMDVILPVDDVSFSFLYDMESSKELLDHLPTWIRDYVQWHGEMRKQYPGMELLTNPNAPNVLIRTCLGVCGGLHDRLGQLPWDLYLANATNRVLLLAWQRPRSLENFLLPNYPQLLDWRVPSEFRFGFDDMHRVRNFTGLFQGYAEDHPTDEFWNHGLDIALERAISGEFRHRKVLRHRILGHLGEDVLQQRLNQVGATDLVHAAPQFGRIFWLFFRPSRPVEQWIFQIIQELQLQVFQYSAVHCRVRHPKATTYGNHVLGKNPKYPADKTGLPWEGETRQFALDVAKDALNCSRLISTPSSPVVYFLSDSNDLVRHVSLELTNPSFVQQNRSMMDNELYQLIHQTSTTLTSTQPQPWVRARDVTEETAHLDRQKGRQAPAYYATFVDLILVVHAQCVIYGIGYYAAFGAKISGTNCQYLYQQEAWGNQAAKVAQVCPNTIHSSR